MKHCFFTLEASQHWAEAGWDACLDQKLSAAPPSVQLVGPRFAFLLGQNEMKVE